ncbi:MAG: hypothetical protein J6A15_01360 [Clostridia bacterium]|nr:hypothetical protein [Clostridia bacterium]
MIIDYCEIAQYYMDIINDIGNMQNKITGWKWREEPEPSEELLKKAKKDSSDCYWSFERAFDRAKDVQELIEFANEPDFATYALGNLRNTKSRIEGFLEDACLTYPEYDLNKYDNILEDFYNAMEHYEGATSKYYNINYIRTNINLGICHDVDHHYSLLSDFDDEIREKDTKILDEIVELVKQLYGFKAPTDKKSNFVNYYRWNNVNEKI